MGVCEHLKALQDRKAGARCVGRGRIHVLRGTLPAASPAPLPPAHACARRQLPTPLCSDWAQPAAPGGCTLADERNQRAPRHAIECSRATGLLCCGKKSFSDYTAEISARAEILWLLTLCTTAVPGCSRAGIALATSESTCGMPLFEILAVVHV